jgi:thiol-disulfide isomerase/thioredoxin
MLTLFFTSAFAATNCPLTEAPKTEIQQFTTTELSQFLEQGKGCDVLIEVWASWCAPCISIVPYLKEFHSQHPSIQIISISADNTLGEMKKFIKTHQVPGIQIHLKEWSIANLEQVFAPYDLSFPGRIPYLVLLDPKGSTVMSLTEPGEEEFNKLMHFKEPKNAP